MRVNTIIKAGEENFFEEINSFFVKLLEEGIIDYLLVPQRISQGRTLTQTLIKNEENLEGINPFSLVMPANSATIVSQLSNSKSGEKIGVVMKPCEVRALVELVKLGQARLENLFIIETDCGGTYEVEDYARLMDEEDGDTESKEMELLLKTYSGETDFMDDDESMVLRSSCQICNAFFPQIGDMTLNLIGMEGNILINMDSELAEKLGMEKEEEPPYSHQDAVEELRNSRDYKRESCFDEFRDKMESINDFADALATCTRCHACQSACPVCYCRVCFFKTETFAPESERFLRWAEKEGALRMPPEILLFHLTRMNHMAASCIGCGMCESSCPRGLPLSTMFQAVGEEVQKKLEYVPGRSVDEPIPISTFKEGEL